MQDAQERKGGTMGRHTGRGDDFQSLPHGPYLLQCIQHYHAYLCNTQLH